MQTSHCMHRGMGFILLAFSLSPIVGPPPKAQPLQSPARKPLEITRIDLFGQKDRDSTRVSVRGFKLGMERREVFKGAQQEGLNLDDKAGQGCLKEKTCNLYSSRTYRGVDLDFSAEDALEKITIQAYLNSVPKKEESGWLVSEFLGATRQLCQLYSDNLRIRVLGNADAYAVKMRERPSMWWKSARNYWPAPVHYEYQYSRIGLVLNVDLNGRDFLV